MIERQIIDCACGCGMLLEDRDQWSHKRRFVNGHNSRMRTTEDRKRIAERAARTAASRRVSGPSAPYALTCLPSASVAAGSFRG